MLTRPHLTCVLDATFHPPKEALKLSTSPTVATLLPPLTSLIWTRWGPR
jgi:hypothetical protein